jgi:hypothetical protein
MPQFSFLPLRETVRASAEIRRECAEMARRARAELVETRAATGKIIIESRKLMAEIDVLVAWK